MRVDIQDASPESVEADFLAVALPDGPLSGAAGRLDGTLGGRIAPLLEAGDIDRDLGSATLVHLDGALGAPRLVVAAAGKAEELDAEALRTAGAAAARAAPQRRRDDRVAARPDLPLPLADQARAAVEGISLGAYDPARWRTEPDRRKPLERIVLVGGGDGVAAAAERARKVTDWANRARDLVNSPPNEATPERLAAERPGDRRLARTPRGRGSLDRAAMRRAGDGRHARRRAGQPQRAAPDRDPLRAAEPDQPGRRPRLRRQGDHLRHGRDLAQAVAAHGGHEGRHGRRRRRCSRRWARSPT